MHNKILIVEDDVECKKAIVKFFTDREFSTTAVNNEDNALLMLKYESFDVAIIEFWQNGAIAEKLCRTISNNSNKTSMIIICRHQSPEIERKAREFAPAFYFVKPVNMDDLYAVVLRLFEIKWRKQQQTANIA